jgi:hypothetical protein
LPFNRQQRLVVAGGIVALIVWIVVLLLDDGSVLGILVREVPSYVGWASDSTAADALRRMSKYKKKGRYDDAIKAGIAWTQRYPDAGYSNGWIYTDVSALYLKKAAKDGDEAEEDVKQAVVYRDKALPFSTDSLYSLQRLAAISESAGDLSAPQRCVQYRNTMKLLIIVCVRAFPFLILPILQIRKGILLSEWFQTAIREPSPYRDLAEFVLIFALMVIALTLPIKAFFFRQENPQTRL